MTTGPTPTPPPRNEGEYARKLALAILSTLEQKGVLSRLDVDTILHAAHRAANPPAPARPATPVGPAVLGTRWVKPGEAPAPGAPAAASTSAPTIVLAADPAVAPDAGQLQSTAPAQDALPTAETHPTETHPAETGPAEPEAVPPARKPAAPPVIDFTLD